MSKFNKKHKVRKRSVRPMVKTKLPRELTTRQLEKDQIVLRESKYYKKRQSDIRKVLCEDKK